MTNRKYKPWHPRRRSHAAPCSTLPLDPALLALRRRSRRGDDADRPILRSPPGGAHRDPRDELRSREPTGRGGPVHPRHPAKAPAAPAYRCADARLRPLAPGLDSLAPGSCPPGATQGALRHPERPRRAVWPPRACPDRPRGAVPPPPAGPRPPFPPQRAAPTARRSYATRRTTPSRPTPTPGPTRRGAPAHPIPCPTARQGRSERIIGACSRR